MKILYITADRFPPYRADVVELFARQLVSRGHQIDWIMDRSDEAQALPSRVEWEGCRVRLGARVRGRGLVRRIVRNLSGLLTDLLIPIEAFRTKYDVIQVRDRFVTGLIAWAAARMTGAKFVYWMSYPYGESKIYQAQNEFVPHPRLTRLKGYAICWMLYNVVLRLADHVFVQSEQMKKDVARQGINPEKMTPVPMGIRADQVGSPDSVGQLNIEAPRLLYLGIILQLRQTEMLVRVLGHVRQRYPGATLLYVGEGQNPSDRQAVIDEAKKLGLEHAVTVTGFLPMDEAWKHVREADICFSPFYPTPVLNSTSPTKIIEYLAMAKCVVANQHPEQTLIMREAGLGEAVEWDEAAFADAACKLLDDPVSAVAAAANGPSWVREHRTYDVIASMVEQTYQNKILPKPGS